METAVPMAWAVGLIISIVLVLAPLRLLAKSRKLSRPHLVILYTMLTVAIPVMNLGLVRQVFMAMYAVPSVFLIDGNNTYRTVYSGSDPMWFPVTPTREGLAWNQGRRLIELLDDKPAFDARVAAQQTVIRTVARLVEARAEAEDQATVAVDPDTLAAVTAAIGKLGPAQLQALGKALDELPGARPIITAYDLPELIAQRAAAAEVADREAAAALREALPRVSELAVSLLAVSDDPAATGFITDSKDQRLSKSARTWIDDDYHGLPDAWRERIAEELAWLLTAGGDGLPRWRTLRAQVMALSPATRAEVARELVEHRRVEVDAMDEETFTRARVSFLYRLARAERQQLLRQGRAPGEPDQNLDAFINSIGYTPAIRSELNEKSITDQIRAANGQIPWDLWRTPMILWGSMFLLIFFMLMALAELLRRKWVERENLAFPLVEVADYILRHDAVLETAEDPANPPARKAPVNLLFMAGFLLGFLYLSIDAMFHYGYIAADPASTFDASGNLLTVGTLKDMNKVFFVLSPIVLGIGFLMSLNLSFSVWSLFLLFTIVAAVVQQQAGGSITDSLYTGWAGGRNYPFPMEQLIGATLCFAGILLWKIVRSPGKVPGGGAGQGGAVKDAFVTTPLMLLGLTLVPLLIAVLLYHAGVASVGLIAVAAVIAIAQAIAAARVRAESGLHTHWVSYEFAKLPVVLGITALTGASAFGMYAIVAFIPMTLIWRLLPQHLENIELARRNKLAYPVIALGSVAAFVVAVVVGGLFFIHFAYLWGGGFFGEGSKATPTSFNIARYALWTSHFRGEQSLGQLDQTHWVRVYAMVVGFAVFGGLSLLRGRILRFPLHPMGYLILLLSIFYTWVSPYPRGEGGPRSSQESSWLWGSIFVAWLIKFLLIKYGGMNLYKKSKPAFIGLIVGAVACIFVWNIADLAVALFADAIDFEALPMLKNFTEEGLAPYSPRFY